MADLLNVSLCYDYGRPDRFSKIVGNKSTIRRITNMIRKNKLPKVILLTGPTGCGKTTMARIIAKSILCMNRKAGESEPCGTCKRCSLPLNDTTCALELYCEYDANVITFERMFEFITEFQRHDFVYMIDELQDLSLAHLQRMRKLVEGTTATLIFTTSHPDQLEDAFRNRLKSFEFEMKRPTEEEIADYLEQQFLEQSIRFSSRSQLIRIAEELNSEMRPCAQFASRILAEFDGVVDDECLNEIFGKQQEPESASVHRRHRFGSV